MIKANSNIDSRRHSANPFEYSRNAPRNIPNSKPKNNPCSIPENNPRNTPIISPYATPKNNLKTIVSLNVIDVLLEVFAAREGDGTFRAASLAARTEHHAFIRRGDDDRPVILFGINVFGAEI